MISGNRGVKFQSSHECLFSNSLGQKYCVNNNSHTSEPDKYVFIKKTIEIINNNIFLKTCKVFS